MRLSVIAFGLFLLAILSSSMESGEKRREQAHIRILLEEVKPELRASRRDLQKVIRELESKPSRDIYEQSLLEELKRWMKDPSFRRPSKPRKSA
jgi:hypothetical protein